MEQPDGQRAAGSRHAQDFFGIRHGSRQDVCGQPRSAKGKQPHPRGFRFRGQGRHPQSPVKLGLATVQSVWSPVSRPNSRCSAATQRVRSSSSAQTCGLTRRAPERSLTKTPSRRRRSAMPAGTLLEAQSEDVGRAQVTRRDGEGQCRRCLREAIRELRAAGRDGRHAPSGDQFQPGRRHRQSDGIVQLATIVPARTHGRGSVSQIVLDRRAVLPVGRGVEEATP